jgi:hypothetical protein
MPTAKPALETAPDWALDFQRLNLSVVSSMAEQPRNAPLPATAMSAAPIPSTVMPTSQSFAPVFESSYVGHGYGPGVGMGYMEMPHEPENAFADDGLKFDTEAFERAFNVAAADALQLDVESKASMQAENEFDALMRSDEELDQLMSGARVSDLPDSSIATFEINKLRFHESTVAPEPSLQEEQERNQAAMGEDDSDTLALTAKQLLESVSHETSEKFAQSSFLALMRRLRDKEVRVEGEDFIEVGACHKYVTAVILTMNSRQLVPLQTQLGLLVPRLKSRRV